MAFSVVSISSFARSSISSMKCRSGPVALSGPLWGLALFFDRKKRDKWGNTLKSGNWKMCIYSQQYSDYTLMIALCIYIISIYFNSLACKLQHWVSKPRESDQWKIAAAAKNRHIQKVFNISEHSQLFSPGVPSVLVAVLWWESSCFPIATKVTVYFSKYMQQHIKTVFYPNYWLFPDFSLQTYYW